MILLKELYANVNALCTSSILKSTSSASRAIAAVAQLFVLIGDDTASTALDTLPFEIGVENGMTVSKIARF